MGYFVGRREEGGTKEMGRIWDLGREERENEKMRGKEELGGGGRAILMWPHGLGSVWRVAQKTHC